MTFSPVEIGLILCIVDKRTTRNCTNLHAITPEIPRDNKGPGRTTDKKQNGNGPTIQFRVLAPTSHLNNGPNTSGSQSQVGGRELLIRSFCQDVTMKSFGIF